MTPGQLVAELDPVRYEAAVAKASAEVAAKNQVLARLLAGSRPEVVQEARERVKAEEANLADAKALHERMKYLVRTGSTSKQKFDDTERAFKTAGANLKAAKQELILTVKGPRKEDIALARAQLTAAEAALKLSERELTDTKLYAPECRGDSGPHS